MRGARGFTLTEVTLAIAGMTIIALGAGGLINICMKAQASEEEASAIYRDGFLAMERMTSGVRKCTYLLIPNNHTVTRTVLAFSGTYNDDDDNYFDDPLFPRIDEDVDSDMSDDGEPGIGGWDDDGDGSVDETSDSRDEDETSLLDEDPLNGLDDDGDGNIDEDAPADMNNDGYAGIWTIDDDGDSLTDEGAMEDDDEDGNDNEDPQNPIIYSYDATAHALIETFLETSAVGTLCTNVTDFKTYYYRAGLSNDTRIRISLTITPDDGEAVTFTEYVYPENIVQKCGKRVR